MKVLERMVQEIYPGKNEALEDLDKRYDAVESSLGFPPKKRYWCISGPHQTGTLIVEREWESFAAFEAAYEKAFANEEHVALGDESMSIVKNNRIELYTPA